MPTSSSDAEGTPSRPRRRTTTRAASATTRRSTSRTRRPAENSDEAVIPVAGDDDFGSGVDEKEPSAPRSSRASRELEFPDTSREPAETDRPRARRERTRRAPAAAPVEAAPPSPAVSADADVIPELRVVDRGERTERTERPGRGERTSNRFERNIADVESQSPMRYFSTEDLDFGDDDEPPRPASSRGRQRNDVDADVPFESPPAASTDAGDPRSSRFEGRPRGPGRGPGMNRGSDRGPGRGPNDRRREMQPRPDAPGYGYAEHSDEGHDFEGFESEGNASGDDLDRDRGEAPRSSDADRGPRQPPRRRRRRRRGGGGVDGPGDPRDSRDIRDTRPNDPRGFQNTRNDPGRRSPGPRNDGGRGRGRGRGPGVGSRNDSRGGRDMGRSHDSGIRRPRAIQPSTEVVEGTFEGVLELHHRGYGFLRDPKRNYAAEDSNPFVSSSLVEKYKLRQGVLIRGDVGQGTRNQGPRLRDIELIDGFTPEEYANVRHFDTLTAINPFEQIKLEVGPRPITMRVMDLLCPIGKGQRALLVAPPRTGKTMLLQEIANSVSINHPEIHLMVLLIDERPEEVTEMRRMVKGEVISSSLDSDVDSHIRIAELIIERAKRLAEEGKDVFVLLDSITRLARAFNKANNTGRTGTGGLDIRALDIPKKLFGQARRFDEGGSLTVCGTALIDTGGKMDEAIFQEFKGTGNMEMVLSRELADRRIWPSIDITKSGTRREEKILAPDLLEGITMLRRSLISLSPVEAMEQLTRTMEKFPTNREFLSRIKAVL